MSRLHFVTARAVFDAFPTASEDIVAAPTDQPPLDYIRALVAGPTPDDALAFCAYVMPRRATVWWAIQSLRALLDKPTPDDNAVLQAAEDWVRAPDEPKRNALLKIGMEADVKRPVTWVARAAGWSGGSLVPDNDQCAHAPPHLTAVAARTAINVALVGNPNRVAEIARCADRCIQFAES